MSTQPSKNRDVRISAIYALGRLGDPVAVEPLISVCVSASENGDADVFRAVAVAMLELGESVVIPLIGLLRHKNPRILGAAIDILARLDDHRAVPALIERLVDTRKTFFNDRVCDMAVWALEKIGTPEALAAVKKWRAEQDK